MRKILVLTVVMACGALGAGVALGVTGGSPDSTHTYVGAALQPQSQGGVTGTELCSGFLISATKFVTAAHCFETSQPVYVSFDQTVSPAQESGYVVGTVVDDPAYCPDCGRGGTPIDDVAVITLSQPQPGPYATLPQPGSDSALQDKQPIDVVGYGVQGNGKKVVAGIRELATTRLKNQGSADANYLRLAGEPGACEGDSGGPDLIGSVAVGLNTYKQGSSLCGGSSYAQRLDDPAIQAFVYGA